MTWIKSLKEDMLSFSSKERLFALLAMLCSFFIAAEYAITRPVSNAFFLTTYGSSFLPWVWLATLPLNFLLIILYNKYLPRLGCLKMFVAIASAVALVNTFCSFYLPRLPCLSFVFYLWKDIYIMLMFQQLWSVIHLTISFHRARYLYGLFFAVGALGASLGSLLPGFFASQLGSESLLLMTAPLYLLLGTCFYFVLKNTQEGTSLKLSEEKRKTSWEALAHGFRLISSSKYLTLILMIVVFMQFSATLVDFQFNSFLEKTIIHKDLRTEYMGRLLGIIHFVTLFLQLIGAFLLIHFLGIRRSHLFIPCFLGLNALAFQLAPLFGVASLVYASVKSCDFSLFNILKELLYIPLSPDEKFRAKALIDVFAHRSSKALAAILILGAELLLSSACLPVIGWSCVTLFVLWMILVLVFLKEPQQVPAKAEDEMPQKLERDDAS